MTNRRPSHPVQAFRVDPGWYAAYWLEEAPARPPGLGARGFASVARAAGALRRLCGIARRPAPAIRHTTRPAWR